VAAVREPPGLPASGGSGARLGGMSNESELLSGTVKISRAKDAEWLRPTGIAVGCSAARSEHTDMQDRRCIGRG